MRRLLILALLGCASSGARTDGRPAAPDPTIRDRVILVDERGRVYRTTDMSTTESQEAPGTVEQAVQALVGVYGDLDMPVTTVEPRTGRVGVQNFAPKSRLGGRPVSNFIDCGTGQGGTPRAATYALAVEAWSTVQPSSAGFVTISTTLTATGRQRGTSTEAVSCRSTGALEKQVNTLAATRLVR